jgi:hypothetical protein
MAEAWWVHDLRAQSDPVTTWRDNWARSISDNFRAGVEIVRGYQRQRQNVYEVIIISLVIGVLANILSQALLGPPQVNLDNSTAGHPSSLPVISGVVVLMIILVAIFLWNQQRYGPRGPAETSITLDYPTLLASYDRERRDDIQYVMAGAGVCDFEGFAKLVLKRALDGVVAVFFRRGIPTPEEAVMRFQRSPPHVSISCDLNELAQTYNMASVQVRLVLLMHANLFNPDPIRTNSVSLRITISVTNPTTPLADDFLTQVIQPLLPHLAESYSYAFWTELLALSPISELRNLVRRVHDYKMSKNESGDWYLMNIYPYDGKSRQMIVIDKPLVNREPSPFSPDPLSEVIGESSLYGCYVTDSEAWIPAQGYRSLFGLSHHLSDELIYIKPERVITIGARSKRRVKKELKVYSEKTDVVNLFTNVTRCDDLKAFRNRLQREFEKMLR